VRSNKSSDTFLQLLNLPCYILCHLLKIWIAAGVPYIVAVHLILSSELHQQKHESSSSSSNSIQFNLLMWRLNSARPIKIATTDTLQSSPSTTAQHLTQWHQIMVYR